MRLTTCRVLSISPYVRGGGTEGEEKEGEEEGGGERVLRGAVTDQRGRGASH